MDDDDEEWRWPDFVGLTVAVVWGVQYTAGLFVSGYIVPQEVSYAMLGIMTALGVTTPPGKK